MAKKVTMAEMMKEGIEKSTGKKLELLSRNEKYELNKTYYCGHWRQFHTITNISQHPIFRQQVTSLWDDGRTTIHATPLDYNYDLKVAEGEHK
jgi:hypothetical protein